jgi:hypothetical protein
MFRVGFVYNGVHMEYLNEIVAGLVITIIGGLVLYYIFGIGKKVGTVLVQSRLQKN